MKNHFSVVSQGLVMHVLIASNCQAKEGSSTFWEPVVVVEYGFCGNSMISLRYQPALGARLKGVAM